MMTWRRFFIDEILGDRAQEILQGKNRTRDANLYRFCAFGTPFLLVKIYLSKIQQLKEV